ncbi:MULTISPECIES: signal recognition particle protein [unclassified Spiroplasma]|uniref:signal recognition particle protein n=1 Tax=unclassified Spiroplasma TaxID=2637901 RepID=UPI0030D59A07
MFTDFLANRITKAIKKNIKTSTLTEQNMEATLSEIKLALLEADVNFNVVKEFVNNVRDLAKGEFILEGLKPEQMLIKIVHNELIRIMGHKEHLLNLNKRPTVIMMVGLQGSGKTTTTAKLANLLRKKYHKNSLLVACDVYRPAAIEQLKSLGKQLDIPVFSLDNEKDVVKIANNALNYAMENKFDVVIVDTAGRLHIDSVLMDELSNLKQNINPQEILIVVDAMTGQEIINVTERFHQYLNLTGTILSKLDGDARGGAALSISHLTKIPIMFAGTGEKVEALDIFYPERMADRILGMGDVQSLFEKAQDVVDERSIQKTMNRMMMGQFDLDDLANQMKQMSKMGKLSGIIKMMPGVNNLSDAKIEGAESKLLVTRALLDSMTKKERRDPRLLKHLKRKNRIIKGSGRNEKEFNNLINQFEKAKKSVDAMAKQIKSGRMPDFSKFKR